MYRKTKSLVALLVLFVLTNILCPLVKAENSAQFLLGDSNGDNEVSVIDATLIQRAVTQIQPIDAKRYIAADTDHDGLLSVIDSSLIQRWLAEIQVLFPVGELVTQDDLDELYPQTNPTESTPAPHTAEISADGKTAIAYGITFDISDIPDTLLISGDGSNVTKTIILKQKSEIAPKDITIQVNNGKYDYMTDYSDSRFKENYLFTAEGKQVIGYDCLVRNNKGEEAAWVSAHYESGMKYPFRASIYGLKTEAYSFPIDFYYKDVLLKRCTVTVDLQENSSTIKNTLDEVKKIERVCWKDSMSKKEKLKELSIYIANNYSYSQVICNTGAEYAAFAARDLGLTSMLLYPVEAKDLITYNLYYDTTIPGGHCACLVDYGDHTLRYDVQGGNYQIREYK